MQIKSKPQYHVWPNSSSIVTKSGRSHLQTVEIVYEIFSLSACCCCLSFSKQCLLARQSLHCHQHQHRMHWSRITQSTAHCRLSFHDHACHATALLVPAKWCPHTAESSDTSMFNCRSTQRKRLRESHWLQRLLISCSGLFILCIHDERWKPCKRPCHLLVACGWPRVDTTNRTPSQNQNQILKPINTNNIVSFLSAMPRHAHAMLCLALPWLAMPCHTMPCCPFLSLCLIHQEEASVPLR